MASTITGIDGTCPGMCSTKERARREKARLLHRFEMMLGTEKSNCPKADSEKCVKEYSRAAAGQKQPKPSDVRPPSTLRTTVRYLFEKILSQKAGEELFSVLYDFTFDRLRAVRQDMVLQNIWNADCMYMLECCVRFHIYSSFKLCEEPISHFDPHINATHLRECLQRLLVIYQNDDLPLSRSRAEMEAYYILCNLGSFEALRHTLSLPRRILNDRLLSTALKINLASLNRNHCRVFRLISQLPFLCTAAVLSHITSIRRSALHIMSHGYSVKNCKFPLAVLQRLLLFDDLVETKNACSHYGIETDSEFAVFCKTSFETNQPFMTPRQYRFIKQKYKGINLLDVLYGAD